MAGPCSRRRTAERLLVSESGSAGFGSSFAGISGKFFPLLWAPVSSFVKWASTFSGGVRTETVCDVEHVPGFATGVLALQEYALSPAFSPASCLFHTFSQGSGETWQQRGLVAESLPNDIDLTGS